MKFRMDFETFFRSRLNPHLIGRNSSLLMSNHPKFEKKLLPQPKNNTPLPTKKSRKQKKTSSKFKKKNPSTTKKHLSKFRKKTHPPHTERKAHTLGGLKNNVTRWNHAFLRQFRGAVRPRTTWGSVSVWHLPVISVSGWGGWEKTSPEKTSESVVISIVRSFFCCQSLSYVVIKQRDLIFFHWTLYVYWKSVYGSSWLREPLFP